MKKIMLKNVQKTMPILLACAMCFGLTACGTKGPLYIPEQRYPDGVPKDQGVPKATDKGVENDATKKEAPEANSGAPSSLAQ